MKIIRCRDCRTNAPHYAKRLCALCYAYQLRTGTRRKYQREHALNWKYCEICLGFYKPGKQDQRFCSQSCKVLYGHYQCYRGRELECQGCHRVRTIRAKKLCASCYSYARQLLNRAGIYGTCSSRIRRLRNIN